MKNNTENLERITARAENLRLAESDLERSIVRAVLDGASWQEVGAALGVSKQTAHNRYAKAVEHYARIESGEYVPLDGAEISMGYIYNPHPILAINPEYRSNYLRTERQ